MRELEYALDAMLDFYWTEIHHVPSKCHPFSQLCGKRKCVTLEHKERSNYLTVIFDRPLTYNRYYVKFVKPRKTCD